MSGLLDAMQCDDIDEVLAVIESQDEDDAAEAAESYRKIGGCLDQFVFRHNGKIIGVTGYTKPPGCDNTYWLSWTYIHDDYANQGFGRKMLTELIRILKNEGGSQAFCKSQRLCG